MKSKHKRTKIKTEKPEPFTVDSAPDDVLISYTRIIFDQVKLQQEVRDRWFEHYIAIIGAITGIATLCLGLFSNSMQTNYLLLLAGGIFILASILGILFYMLYLNQRYNYKQNYKLLSALEAQILKRQMNNEVRPFTTRKHGADYTTLLIENVICAACFTASSCFLASGFNLDISKVFLIGIITFCCCIIVLQIIYHRWEKRQ